MLMPTRAVADIGSGTGLSCELFLQHGNCVFAVEPNADMREAAEIQFAKYSNFISINGSAEATSLPDTCIDLITVGQAFHWFDPIGARDEFRRILKPGGWVAVFWYGGTHADTPFGRGLAELTQRCYAISTRQHRPVGPAEMAAFFSPYPYVVRVIEKMQFVGYDTLKDGFLSSAYAPRPGDPQYEPMLEALDQLFHDNAGDGQVPLPVVTSIYAGRLGK